MGVPIGGDEVLLGPFHVEHDPRHPESERHLLNAQQIPAAPRAVLLEFDLPGIAGANCERLFHDIVLLG